MIMETADDFFIGRKSLLRDSKKKPISKWEELDVDFSTTQIPWG